MAYAPFVVTFFAPGFTPEQVVQGAMFLRILMPFIFLISFSALLAGPLQAVGHFFIPAFGPVLLNIGYVGGLLVCLWFKLPVTALCWFIIGGGVVQLLAHLFVFFRLHFSFSAINRHDLRQFGPILFKFFWAFLSMSVMEIGFLVDKRFASMLPAGSISLISYAMRFMGIPLGVFAVAFSTTLLSHFSRVSAYAPKRLGFYVMEATKVVWWVTFPAVLIMAALSRTIFLTIFYSEKFTLAHVDQAAGILQAFLLGLFFFSINKILSNVYYAIHETRIPGIFAVISVALNAFLNWILMGPLQAAGLALATTLAGAAQTVLLFVVLKMVFGFKLYFSSLLEFIMRYTLQVVAVGLPFVMLYQLVWYSVSIYLPSFFITSLGFWLWVGPLCLLFYVVVYATRGLFKTEVLFLE